MRKRQLPWRRPGKTTCFARSGVVAVCPASGGQPTPDAGPEQEADGRRQRGGQTDRAHTNSRSVSQAEDQRSEDPGGKPLALSEPADSKRLSSSEF